MLRNPNANDQIFGHRLNGTEIKINVTKLRQALDSNKESTRGLLTIEEELVKRLVADSGVEGHRVTRLLAKSDEDFSKLPIPIVILFRDRSWVLADGNHTVCAAFYRKITELEVYQVKPKKWQQFQVTGVRIPYFGFSGIR